MTKIKKLILIGIIHTLLIPLLFGQTQENEEDGPRISGVTVAKSQKTKSSLQTKVCYNSCDLESMDEAVKYLQSNFSDKNLLNIIQLSAAPSQDASLSFISVIEFLIPESMDLAIPSRDIPSFSVVLEFGYSIHDNLAEGSAKRVRIEYAYDKKRSYTKCFFSSITEDGVTKTSLPEAVLIKGKDFRLSVTGTNKVNACIAVKGECEFNIDAYLPECSLKSMTRTITAHLKKFPYHKDKIRTLPLQAYRNYSDNSNTYGTHYFETPTKILVPISVDIAKFCGVAPGFTDEEKKSLHAVVSIIYDDPSTGEEKEMLIRYTTIAPDLPNSRRLTNWKHVGDATATNPRYQLPINAKSVRFWLEGDENVHTGKTKPNLLKRGVGHAKVCILTVDECANPEEDLIPTCTEIKPGEKAYIRTCLENNLSEIAKVKFMQLDSKIDHSNNAYIDSENSRTILFKGSVKIMVPDNIYVANGCPAVADAKKFLRRATLTFTHINEYGELVNIRVTYRNPTANNFQGTLLFEFLSYMNQPGEGERKIPTQVFENVRSVTFKVSEIDQITEGITHARICLPIINGCDMQEPACEMATKHVMTAKWYASEHGNSEIGFVKLTTPLYFEIPKNIIIEPGTNDKGVAYLDFIGTDDCSQAQKYLIRVTYGNTWEQSPPGVTRNFYFWSYKKVPINEMALINLKNPEYDIPERKFFTGNDFKLEIVDREFTRTNMNEHADDPAYQRVVGTLTLVGCDAADGQNVRKSVTKYGNSFELYPNPCNENINIAYSLSEEDKLTIQVKNLIGQQVSQVVLVEPYLKGEHHINISTKDLFPGLYIVSILSEGGISENLKFIKK